MSHFVSTAEQPPPPEPFDSGMLDVGGGQHIYYEQVGNPAGKPMVILHGGPGGGCSVGMRRTGNPAKYRIILFDQRGCGRSTPHAAEHGTSLEHNTTAHLLGDIEELREHLGIEKWLVFGGSWGSSLGLAYAEQHPERVTELVLLAIFLSQRDELAWLYGGLRRFLPIEFEAFRNGVPEGLRDGDLIAVYNELLNSADPEVRQAAADAWVDWENAVISLDPGTRGPGVNRADPRYRLAFARLCAHYFSHGAWLRKGQLLENVHRLKGIPAVLIHGRVDPQGPLSTAWELSQAWPESELVILDNAGHTSPVIGTAINEALERFAGG